METSGQPLSAAAPRAGQVVARARVPAEVDDAADAAADEGPDVDQAEVHVRVGERGEDGRADVAVDVRSPPRCLRQGRHTRAGPLRCVRMLLPAPAAEPGVVAGEEHAPILPAGRCGFAVVAPYRVSSYARRPVTTRRACVSRDAVRLPSGHADPTRDRGRLAGHLAVLPQDRGGGRDVRAAHRADEAEAVSEWFVPGHAVVVAVDAASMLGSAHFGPEPPGRGRTWRRRASWSRPRPQGRASGGRSASTWSPRRAKPGSTACSSTPSSRRTPGPCGSGSRSVRHPRTVPEAFDHPTHGLVGLHVMYRRLGHSRRLGRTD